MVTETLEKPEEKTKLLKRKKTNIPTQFSECKYFPFKQTQLPQIKPDESKYFMVYRFLAASEIEITDENMTLALNGLNIKSDNGELKKFLCNEKRLEKIMENLKTLESDNQKNLLKIISEDEREDIKDSKENPKTLSIQIIQSNSSPTLLEITGKEEKYDEKRLKSVLRGLKSLIGFEQVKNYSNSKEWRINLTLKKGLESIAPLELFSHFVRAYQREGQEKEIIKEIKETTKYLGKWKRGSNKLKRDVATFLKDLYGALEEKINVSIQDIYSNKKDENIPKARAMISHALRNKYPNKLSTTEIGEILNGRNHATVILGNRKFGENLDQNIYQKDAKTIVKYLSPRYEGRAKN